MFNNFFPRIVPLLDNVEKYGVARQATDDSVVWLMCFACGITKATDTHPAYEVLRLFHGNSGYMNISYVSCYCI
jgi:hypothetical protein